MGIKSLISYGFLVLPVAITLGVLLGLQTYRESRGWAPPFMSNKISRKEYCQLSFGISPDTTGLQYTRESTRFRRPRPHPFSVTISTPALMTLLGGLMSPLVPGLSPIGTGSYMAKLRCTDVLH